MKEPIAIAIDGPVASGKTAVGQKVADRLCFRFLDTGSMYRAVTWAALERGVDTRDREALSRLAMGLNIQLVPREGGERLLVDDEDVTEYLRRSEVEQKVSVVSLVSGVRRALVKRQRALGAGGGIVMVGRDIGTVVLPGATLKVYLNASVELRARRRHLELQGTGESIDYDRVKSDLVRRDKIDSERTESPLHPAEDAVLIDTDNLTVNELAEKILSVAKRA